MSRSLFSLSVISGGVSAVNANGGLLQVLSQQPQSHKSTFVFAKTIQKPGQNRERTDGLKGQNRRRRTDGRKDGRETDNGNKTERKPHKAANNEREGNRSQKPAVADGRKRGQQVADANKPRGGAQREEKGKVHNAVQTEENVLTKEQKEQKEKWDRAAKYGRREATKKATLRFLFYVKKLRPEELGPKERNDNHERERNRDEKTNREDRGHKGNKTGKKDGQVQKPGKKDGKENGQHQQKRRPRKIQLPAPDQLPALKSLYDMFMPFSFMVSPISIPWPKISVVQPSSVTPKDIASDDIPLPRKKELAKSDDVPKKELQVKRFKAKQFKFICAHLKRKADKKKMSEEKRNRILKERHCIDNVESFSIDGLKKELTEYSSKYREKTNKMTREMEGLKTIKENVKNKLKEARKDLETAGKNEKNDLKRKVEGLEKELDTHHLPDLVELETEIRSRDSLSDMNNRLQFLRKFVDEEVDCRLVQFDKKREREVRADCNWIVENYKRTQKEKEAKLPLSRKARRFLDTCIQEGTPLHCRDRRTHEWL